jgi:hypothetical protein
MSSLQKCLSFSAAVLLRGQARCVSWTAYGAAIMNLIRTV